MMVTWNIATWLSIADNPLITRITLIVRSDWLRDRDAWEGVKGHTRPPKMHRAPFNGRSGIGEAEDVVEGVVGGFEGALRTSRMVWAPSKRTAMSSGWPR